MRELENDELIRRAINGQLLDVRTSMAAEVVSFDANTMRATIRPGVCVQGVDADTVQAEVDELADLQEVPVIFPAFGPFILYAPLAAGDAGRLEWSEEDDGDFYHDANVSVPVCPRILKRHGAQAVFRPGGFRGEGVLGGESTNKLFLGRPDGAGVQISESEVKLGDSSASNFVALANLVNAQFTELKAVFSGWVPQAADGGAALKTAVTAWATTPADVSATKTKAT